MQPPDLRTDTLVLRPWRLDDLDDLVAELQDPEIPRWTRIPEPYGREERRYLEIKGKRRDCVMFSLLPEDLV